MNGGLEGKLQRRDKPSSQQPRLALLAHRVLLCGQNPRFSVASRLLAQLAKHPTTTRPGFPPVQSLGYAQAGRAAVRQLSRPGLKGCLHAPWLGLQSEASCFNSTLTLTPILAQIPVMKPSLRWEAVA